MSDPEPAEAVTEDGQDRATDDSQAMDCAEDPPDDHVEDLPDGAGCTEIWEHLSERRADDD